MAKMIDLFGAEPRLKFNQLESTTLSPEKIWADYDEETDSVVFYFTGQPVSAISVYLKDDLYVMVEPESKNVVGIHIEALEQKFLAKHPLLQRSWPYVKQTLSKGPNRKSNSLLQLFSFGLAFLIDENEKTSLQPA